MRRRVFEPLALVLLLTAGAVLGQTPESTTAQSRVVGVVIAVDSAVGRITIKNDAGETQVVIASPSSSLLRLPPGETVAQNAVKIAIGDISIGDRLFARGAIVGDGKSIEARQIVVTGTGATGAAAEQQRQRDDFRRRGLMGRVLAVSPDKKEISLQSRSREGTGPITVVTTDATRVFRYAPDSLNIAHASRSSLSELRAGDQLRALGERNQDGTRFTAEEIIAGSITRTGGEVISVDSTRNELKIKNTQGQTVTVALGPRSSLRRVTPEMAASFAARQPRERRRGDQPGQEGRTRERRDREPNASGEARRPRGGGGGGMQNMLENLPAVNINELKKGDAVFVSGSEGTDPSRVTAIMLVTGDNAFITRMLQQGPNRGPQNPGLPGDVMGGGVGPAERPPNP
jgi:hypothetical protein